MVVPTWLAIIVVVILYAILPSLLCIFIKNDKLLFRLSLIYFLIFLVVLAFCVFTTVDIGKDFVTINIVNNGKWFSKKISFVFNNDLKDILINLAMLFPVGFITGCWTRYKNKKFMLIWAFVIGLCIGSIIEFGQFAFPIDRSVQLSDIVYNGLSGLIGGINYFLLNLIHKRKTKKLNE